jgi:hypothetical protein
MKTVKVEHDDVEVSLRYESNEWMSEWVNGWMENEYFACKNKIKWIGMKFTNQKEGNHMWLCASCLFPILNIYFFSLEFNLMHNSWNIEWFWFVLKKQSRAWFHKMLIYKISHIMYMCTLPYNNTKVILI